ncbi:MAG: adenosylcobinamide amidohydrolase [Nitrospira sp.]
MANNTRSSSGRRFTTRFFVNEDTLVVDLMKRRRALSSAPRLGGLVTARSIINHQVPDNPVPRHESGKKGRRQWGDPARYLGLVARSLAAPEPCVGLMTAVLMRRLIVLREESGELWIEGFLTVGVTNAVRAGHAAAHHPAGATGTINMILITNAALSASAMVTLVQVATESKTAALLAHGVKTWTGQPGATGTGTDAVVVVSGDGPATKYGGTHTRIGALVGRLVMKGVTRGLSMSRSRGSRRRDDAMNQLRAIND